MTEPRPDADQPPRPATQPRSGFFAQPSSGSDLGAWGDREDAADRLAFENARREQLDARPPHH